MTRHVVSVGKLGYHWRKQKFFVYSEPSHHLSKSSDLKSTRLQNDPIKIRQNSNVRIQEIKWLYSLYFLSSNISILMDFFYYRDNFYVCINLTDWYCFFQIILNIDRGLGYNHSVVWTQRIHDAIVAPLLRQNDVAMSFRRNNSVIITSCVYWEHGCEEGKLAVVRVPHLRFTGASSTWWTVYQSEVTMAWYNISRSHHPVGTDVNQVGRIDICPISTI